MSALRNVFSIIFLFITFGVLEASWDPKCLDLDNRSVLEELDKQAFISLQSSISEYLQNSWCSKDKSDLLLSLVVLISPKVCVEIGPFTGSTTLPILAGLQYRQQGKAYVIDAWSCEEAVKGLPSSDKNTKWWSSLDMISIKKEFYDMLDDWSLRSYCKIIPVPSEKAAEKIPPIDFLHLDGNFSEEGALLDCKLYVPKVKSGGHIVLSNVHVLVNRMPTKMKALMVLLDECELLYEIDDGATLLFRKN